MKKILILTIPLIFFYSCEEDNNSTECLLYGTWEFYSEDGYSDECMVYCNASIIDSPCDPETIYVGDLCAQMTFNEDGSFYYLQENPSYYYEGAWSGDCNVGETITIIELKTDPQVFGASEYYINSMNSNSLILTEGDYYRLVLRK